jgi:O-antigen/teichoic acid export membrane protein
VFLAFTLIVWLGTFIAVFLLFKSLRRIEQDSTHMTIREVASISWPLWLTNLTALAMIQADIWIAGIFTSADEVAIYGTAAGIAFFVLSLTGLLHVFIPPIITQLKVEGKIQELEYILRGGATICGLLTFPLALMFILFPAEILAFLFGEHYSQGGGILFLLTIGMFFNTATGMRGAALMLTEHERVQMVISLIGGTMNIVFCVLGAWKIGINGIAAGAMAGMILQSVMELIAVKKILGIWTFASPLYIKGLKKVILTRTIHESV